MVSKKLLQNQTVRESQRNQRDKKILKIQRDTKPWRMVEESPEESSIYRDFPRNQHIMVKWW